MILLKNKPILPGFRLSLAITLFSFSILIILPFAVLILDVLDMGLISFYETISSKRVLSALFLTLVISFFAVLTNVIFGVLIAWVLVKYQFKGKQFVNALVDLPFALPTSVTGITLASLYSPNGWLGQLFAPFGIKIAFTPIGIWIALIVVSLPFIVRSIQPILEDMTDECEEAATVLGAHPWLIFRKIILPEIFPALLGGSAVAFARCTGEYGSVIFIAGSIPFVSEILPLIIVSKFELFELKEASAIAVLMLFISFIILLILNIIQRYLGRFR